MTSLGLLGWFIIRLENSDCNILDFRDNNFKRERMMAKFYNGPENQVCKLEGSLSSVEMRLMWYAGKDVPLLLLLPCRTAKDEYCKQEPSDYVFKCMDGDIHIPEYGLLKTDFYIKEWMM